MKHSKLNLLLIGALLSSIGMSFIWPLTSVYLHDDLKISLMLVGWVLLFSSLASVLGSYCGGLFFDYFNSQLLLVAGITGSIVSFILLIFFHSSLLFAILLFFNGIFSGWNLTIIYAMGANFAGLDSRKVFTSLYFAQNLGSVIGTSLVGFIYPKGITCLFVITTIIYLLFLLLVLTTYRSISTNKPTEKLKIKNTNSKKNILRNKNNLIIVFTLLFSLFFIWSMYQQWASNLSVYMTSLGIPLVNYSFLWTLNALLIMVIQIIIIFISKYSNNIIPQILFGVCMLAFSFLILVLGYDYKIFVISMILLTIGESTAFPAIPAYINGLISNGSKGYYQGLINSFGAAGRAVGPLLGGIIIDVSSYEFLFKFAFAVIFFIFLIITIVLWFLKKKTVRQ